MDNKNYQKYQSSLRALLNQALVEALKRNESQAKTWQEYRKAHQKVKKGLEILPQELTTNCMVPIGRKALMKGKLVHTNEILVCLGEGYFAKYSAKQAIAVCDRRIKQADEMLNNLEKEQNLLEMRQSLPVDYGIFGDDERQEIIESYVEEEEKEWRIKHRQREKEYRQKLAQLRGQERTEIQSEEDLWQRLDELELQEELEDEINRLQQDDCNYYGEHNQDNDDSYEEEDGEFSEDETTDDMIQERLAKLNKIQIPQDQKDLFEKKNLDKEADHGSSSTYDIPNPNQPSSSSTSLDTNTFEIESSRETIDKIAPKDSMSYSNNQKYSNNKKTNANTKLMEQDSIQCLLSESSKTSVSTTSSEGSTDVIESDSVQSSNQSKTEVERSFCFESQPRYDKEILLSLPDEKEGNQFPGENNKANDNEICKSETQQKRRVSFTDKIQVNLFGKLKCHSFYEPLRNERGESSSESDAENEIEKLQIIEDMISVGADLTSNDEVTEDSTENGDDEDDIIRIEFRHSKRRPGKPVKASGDDEIGTPADIHKIFYKPKSILTKSSSDTSRSQSITPPADDVFDHETDEPPFGSSYTIIVKDVEERKPEVLDVNIPSSNTRRLSKFKMARSGIKQ